tara:strand:- start:135367 stop:136056 length:690 start_codon:yes stop_codon:yes gene_type:complete
MESPTVMSVSLEDQFRGRFYDSTLSKLELAAIDWLDGFYQLEHLLSTRAWTIRLVPGGASPELKFAALVHDAERFFPGGPSGTPDTAFDDPDYLFAHSIRSADIVEAWLREQPDVPESFIRRVRALVMRHEIGGNTEEDILQAADSLSWFDTLDWLAYEWAFSGKLPYEKVYAKLDWMLTRIRPTIAMENALGIYRDAMASLEGRNAVAEMDLKDRRRIAGSKKVLLGL